MSFSISDLNLQLDELSPINFNSVETLPGFEARAEFTPDGKEQHDVVINKINDSRKK